MYLKEKRTTEFPYHNEMKLYFNYEKWEEKENRSNYFERWDNELKEIINLIGLPTYEDECYTWFYQAGKRHQCHIVLGFDLSKQNEFFVQFYEHGKEKKTLSYKDMATLHFHTSNFIYILTKYGYIEMR